MLDDFSSTKKPLTIGARIGGVLSAIGLSALLFIAPQLILVGFWPPLARLLPYSDNILNFIFAMLLEALTVLCVVLLVRAYGKRLTDIGLGKWRWGFVWRALAGVVVYFALSIAISVVAGWIWHINFDQKQELGFEAPQAIEYVWVFLGLVVLPPLAEEILFRGFLFTGLRNKLPFWATALIISGLFALAHGQVNVGLDVFALSLVLCFLREKTHSLWPGIMLHALKNGIAFLYLFVYTGPK